MYRIQTPKTGATAALMLERVSLLAPADRTVDALPPQAGPSPYPLHDVFGGWQVVYFPTLPSEPGWPVETK